MATALVVGIGAYHFLQPTGRPRRSLNSSTAPIDESKSRATSFPRSGMETVAARVTPAIVNVAVTAKVDQKKAMMQQQGMPEGLPDDMQQFFERQFGGRGQMAAAAAVPARHRQRSHHLP